MDGKILCLVGYYSLNAQQRLAKDASLCPEVKQQLTLSQMSASAWENFEKVWDCAKQEKIDLPGLMNTPQGLLVQMEQRLRPSDWEERLVKSFVSLGVMADFHRILIAHLHPDIRARLDKLHWTCGHNQWAEKEIQKIIAVDERAISRLSLWGRRVLGDVMSTLRQSTDRFPGLIEELDIPMEQILTELNHSHRDRMIRAGLQA